MLKSIKIKRVAYFFNYIFMGYAMPRISLRATNILLHFKHRIRSIAIVNDCIRSYK
jgi:hypothetical protein